MTIDRLAAEKRGFSCCGILANNLCSHTCLEDAGSVRGSPGVEQIVFPRAHEPFPCGRRQDRQKSDAGEHYPRGSGRLLTAVGESEGEHAALVQVELVLVRFGDV